MSDFWLQAAAPDFTEGVPSVGYLSEMYNILNFETHPAPGWFQIVVGKAKVVKSFCQIKNAVLLVT